MFYSCFDNKVFIKQYIANLKFKIFVFKTILIIGAFYDYLGDIHAKTKTYFSDSKIVYSNIPTKSSKTIYSWIGNIFVYILTVFLLYTLGLKIKSRNDGSDANNI